MEYEIKELDRTEYDYHELHYTYKSDHRYRVERNIGENGFSFSFTKEKCAAPIEHDSYDTLFQEYWTEPSAFGVFIPGEKEPIAYLEVAREFWNARLIITQLLVKDAFRGHGIGKALIKKAEEIALEEDHRLITLETQSCNMPAIDFYKKCGFEFSGTNIFFYSNDDIGEDEVMLEMAKLI